MIFSGAGNSTSVPAGTLPPVPDQLLAQCEIPTFKQSQQCLQRQGGHRRLARFPGVAKLDHDGALGFEHFSKDVCETSQPLDIGVAREVAVLLLPIQRKGRGSENQIHLFLEQIDHFRGAQKLIGLALKAKTMGSAVRNAFAKNPTG
jgi:hypothetical protein